MQPAARTSARKDERGVSGCWGIQTRDKRGQKRFEFDARHCDGGIWVLIILGPGLLIRTTAICADGRTIRFSRCRVPTSRALYLEVTTTTTTGSSESLPRHESHPPVRPLCDKRTSPYKERVERDERGIACRRVQDIHCLLSQTTRGLPQCGCRAREHATHLIIHVLQQRSYIRKHALRRHTRQYTP